MCTVQTVLSAHVSESCVCRIPRSPLLPGNGGWGGLGVCESACAWIMWESSSCRLMRSRQRRRQQQRRRTIPKSASLPHVCLRRSSSVPETTFDLHGDVHSGAALPTSKVTHVHADRIGGRCCFDHWICGESVRSVAPVLLRGPDHCSKSS